ncbi:MAG: cytochrome b [Pseudomonadota bacterium]
MTTANSLSLNASERYNKISIGLHWFMVLLLIAVYATMELHEFFPKGSAPRKALLTWHFMLGLSVLAFAITRLVVRLKTTRPAIIPAPPAWQEILAKSMQVALYTLMICMPIAGWLVLSAAGKTIPFFGLELPALIGQNKELAERIVEVHGTVGNVGYFLIGLHALAGLYHHYFMKDNTLRRMLP